ncbi:MAG: GAF domain-containing sensor histidine kinase, partial [Anaerolineales bacterium]|nr:GAF domain-containing sensor histidine kinase [Anaerolineales bacterium]
MSDEVGQKKQFEPEKEPLELLYNLLRYTLSSNGSTPAQVGKQSLSLIIEALDILKGEIFASDNQQRLKLLAMVGYEETDLAAMQTKIEQRRIQQIFINKVQQTGQEIIIPDVNCHEYWHPFPGLDDEICSIATLPLKADDQVIGILSLLSDRNDYFTDEQQPLLTAIANTVALILRNASLFDQVRSGQNQLRRLAEQLINVQEKERRRVSHALHDETGQALTMLHLSLNAIRRELPADSAAQEKVRQANHVLTETMARIRRLAYDLRPPELDTLGLNMALKTLCQEFDEWARFAITYTGVANLPDLSESVTIAFYRFLQEALTNVAKHAAAGQADVRLSYDEAVVKLEVKDNGQGFHSKSAASIHTANGSMGLGILGMRERFENLSGRLLVESAT